MSATRDASSTNPTQVPIPQARVDFYLQGATVTTGATINPSVSGTVSVVDIGALYDGAVVRLGADGPIFSVNSVVSPTQVSLKNTSGFVIAVPVGTRLLVLSARPTAYQDALGTTSLGTTVICDSGGRAQVFLPEGEYDYLVTDPNDPAVAAVNSTPGTASGATSTLSWSHTTTSGQSLLLVAISWQESTGLETLDSVSYGTHAMTLLASSQFVQLFYLLNPPTGSNTVTATFSGTSTKAAVGGAIGLSNVNATTPFAPAREYGASSTTGGATSAGAMAKSWIFAALGVNTVPGTTTVTLNSGPTSLWNQSIGSTGSTDRTQAAGASRAGSGDSVDITWAISPSRAWGSVSVEVLPAWYSLITDAATGKSCAPTYGILATAYSSLQAAIDALPNQGGVVYVPSGTYRLTQGLVIDRANVTLIGEGVSTVITPADPVNNPVDLLTIRVMETRLYRIKFDGVASAMDLATGHCGIVFDGDDHTATPARLVQHCYLENVVVTGNARYGIWIRDTILLTAINCEVVANKGGGMRIQGGESGGICAALRFIGCAFSGNGWIGVDIGDDTVDYSGMEQISLWGCTIENNQGGTTISGRASIGVNVNANQAIKVELVSCYFEGPPESDAHTQDGCAQMLRFHNCPNVLVRDCRISGRLTTGGNGAAIGVAFVNCSYAQAESNVIQYVTDYILSFDSGGNDCVEMCNRDLDSSGLPRILVQSRRLVGTSQQSLSIPRFAIDGDRPTPSSVRPGSLIWVDTPDSGHSHLQGSDGSAWVQF